MSKQKPTIVTWNSHKTIFKIKKERNNHSLVQNKYSVWNSRNLIKQEQGPCSLMLLDMKRIFPKELATVSLMPQLGIKQVTRNFCILRLQLRSHRDQTKIEKCLPKMLPDLVALEETLLKYGFPLNQQFPILHNSLGSKPASLSASPSPPPYGLLIYHRSTNAYSQNYISLPGTEPRSGSPEDQP